ARQADENGQIDSEVGGECDPAGVERGMRQADAFQHQQPMDRAAKPKHEVWSPAGELRLMSEPEPWQRCNPRQPWKIERRKGGPEQQTAKQAQSKRGGDDRRRRSNLR